MFTAIGVASYGAMGHVIPSTSNCLISQVTSEWHSLTLTLYSTPIGCLSSRIYRPIALSPQVTITLHEFHNKLNMKYDMIFLCVTLNTPVTPRLRPYCDCTATNF